MKTLLSLALVALAASAANAQATATGAFVSTLGNDTIQVERFTRTPSKLEGDILRKSPRVTIVHYVADLSNGKFKGMSVATRRYGADAATVPGFSMMTLIADSTATIEVQRAGRPDTANSSRRVFRGRASPAVPGSPPSVAMYEQILLFNSPAGREPMTVNLIGAGLGKDPTIILARHARDTVTFTSSFFPGWTEVAAVDQNGKIQSLDASATTVKAVTRRVANLDFDGIAKSWAAYEAAHGAAGATSPADTVRATVGNANIEIAYSRPFKRGRKIFGSSIVPLDSVWRTGANAATMFTTTQDLLFGTTVVPAGKYTLWSIPTATGGKLVINSQTGQWGTDYDPSKDFARLDLTQTVLATPVEEFTFQVLPQGNGGLLKFSWDDREFSIPFRVR
jgi:hypothetical protein